MRRVGALALPGGWRWTPRRLETVRRASPGSLTWALAGIAIAIAIGAVSAAGAAAVIPLAIVIAVALAAALWGVSMTDVLIASIFLEVLSFGGLTISRLLAPVALLFVVIALIKGRVRFHPLPLIVPVLAYSLWGLASGLWTVSLPHTVNILGSLAIALVYMLTFATLIHDERDLKRTMMVLAVASMVIGIVSIASFAGTPILASDSLQGGRGQGGVGDPNFFANVQLVALPLILLLATEAKTRLPRVVFAFATLVAITSIFATLSRGGMIALVVFGLTLPFIPARWLFGSRRQKAVVLLAMVLAVGALFTRPAFRHEVVSRVQTLFVGKEADASGASAGSGRTELWKAAFASIDERPVQGLGFGAFPSRSNDLLFGTPGVNLQLIATHPDGIEVHSAYIGTTVDLGFVGLGAFLSIIVTMFIMLGSLASRARRIGAVFLSRVAIALVISMVGWAISSAFIETETARPLWIMIGLTFALGKLLADAEAKARARAPADRFPAVAGGPTPAP